MPLYLTLFGVFSLSGIFWFVSAEGFSVAAGVTGDPRFDGCSLPLLLAASQCVGLTLVYAGGQGLLAWSTKLKARVDKLDMEKLEAATASINLILKEDIGPHLVSPPKPISGPIVWRHTM